MVDLPASCCTEARTLNSAVFELHLWFVESKQSQGYKARREARAVQPSGRNHLARVGRFDSRQLSISVVAQARPNPSLERTSTGMALGPRGYAGHHPPRGPSTTPVVSAQLKR